jgi:HTH-type transcriptional regulator, sugar sensing transcriptional regulator
MSSVDLLQQLGLNKYEAEAYYALLRQGPLTGYELGKRSQVPLSRSYEILERLTQKGLALVQPGDPPRYMAQDAQQFLAQIRSEMEETLTALAASLASLSRADTTAEFWVVRGHQQILAKARTMVTGAQHSLHISISDAVHANMADVIASAQKRGCFVFLSPTLPQQSAISDAMLLLVDQREALVGRLTPEDSCQAVVSSNEALRVALDGYFAHQQVVETSTVPISVQQQSQGSDWLAWEDRKQRHLWRQSTGRRVA